MNEQPRRRRLVYVSGTRADFGLMRSTLLLAAAQMDVSVAVTGMHLSAEFGHTVDEIHAAGLRVCGELPVDVTTRTPQSMAAAVGECLQGLSALLAREQPDLLLLLGDRGEMLAGAVAALHLGISCVHVHGGERSGTVDEPVRHAISKLSTWHFVATEGSRQRLERMGEPPAQIRVTGAPGLDGLSEMAAMPEAECRAALGLAAGQAFVLALFHPVVQQAQGVHAQTTALCKALLAIGLPVVWLAPNADAGSRAVLQALDDNALPTGSQRVQHLSRPVFVAAMRYCAVLVGNSSAGIIEAASLGTPVVNMGSRQNLRERNANVVDVAIDVTDLPVAVVELPVAVANVAVAIEAALRSALDHGPWPRENIYGDGHSGERIAHLLAKLPLDRRLLEKANAY
jgi:GDP/UDP-N,N'-diacetylbacillosamine 2-epimerase (hydrolysing)